MAASPAEYLILSMNANGDSGKGMREERKKYIVQVLVKQDPLVVCVQEFLWQGIHTRGWGHLGVPGYFRYEGHNEAGFIFNTREVTYSRIDNKASVRNMYDDMVKRSDIGLDYFELARLCVCIIKSKGAPNFEIICASWHGPHKVSMKKKEKSLDSLLEFLLKLKVEKDIPLLLAGDFNLPARVVRSRLPSNGSLVLHTPNDTSIDVLITSSELREISGVNTLERNVAFDHSPLGVNLIMKPQPDLVNSMHNLHPPTHYTPKPPTQTPYLYQTFNPHTQSPHLHQTFNPHTQPPLYVTPQTQPLSPYMVNHVIPWSPIPWSGVPYQTFGNGYIPIQISGNGYISI